jgi:hypothetical protein
MTEHKGLVAALASFHSEAPKVIKDATAKVTGESRDGSKIIYALKHESGESEDGFWPLPDPTRVKPQDLGSWITYWRRYAFLAVTNTFPSGEDDDGKQAQQAPRESWDNAQPVRQAMDQHRRGVNSTDDPAPKVEWTDEKIAEYHRKISSSDVTLAVKGYDWLAKEGVHERKVPVSGGDELTATQILAFRLADLAVQPGVDLREVAIIRANAEDRGLLNVKVSDDTTLGEELALAKSQIEAVKATVEAAKADTPDPATA